MHHAVYDTLFHIKVLTYFKTKVRLLNVHELWIMLQIEKVQSMSQAIAWSTTNFVEINALYLGVSGRYVNNQ